MKQMFKSALNNFYPTSLILKRITQSKRFKNENLLLQGKCKPKSTHQSILFYTAHKCASVYTGQILKSLTKNIGMIPIDIENYVPFKFDKQVKELSNHEKKEIIEANFFQPNGYFYGPLRHLRWEKEALALEDYKILLMLRDPRDALTSRYFSQAYSHSLPRVKTAAERMLKSRKEALVTPIDEWVLRYVSGYLKRYENYCENLLGRPNVFFVKYEDMVNDFPTWLNTVIKALELDNVDKELVEKLIHEAGFDVEENVNSHKRQAKPGDHKRKLKPETISKLNETFSEVLDLLNYMKVPA